MDTVPGKVLREQIMSLLAPLSEIKQIEEIKAHRFGPYLMINITICIDGNLSVFEGDRISISVEETIKNNIEFVQTVHVHYHPGEKTSLRLHQQIYLLRHYIFYDRGKPELV